MFVRGSTAEYISIKMTAFGIFVSLLQMASFSMGAPENLHVVDLTHVFDNTTLSYPSVRRFEVDVIKNGTGELGSWIQLEEYCSSTHAGTHMDAPCHFAKGKWCIDDIPVNRLIAPAAVIDVRKPASRNRNYFVHISDLQRWERISGRSLDGTVVMILTGWDRRWDNKDDYLGTTSDDPTMHNPGLSKEATEWLIQNRNIYGLGVDTVSLDNPKSGVATTHQLILGNNIYGLENVANLHEIPIFGATLYVLPMKIGDASAAPVRILATYDRFMYSAAKCSVENTNKVDNASYDY